MLRNMEKDRIVSHNETRLLLTHIQNKTSGATDTILRALEEGRNESTVMLADMHNLHDEARQDIKMNLEKGSLSAMV